jgi:chromatin assembly factor 1 subunit A
MIPTPPDTEESSPMAETGQDRAASPAPSSSALSSILESSSKAVPSTGTAAGPASGKDGVPPAKRRKLSPTEKVEQARVKEAKAAEKAGTKARKEEEARVKDEEKRLKAEVKEEEKRKKEIEMERKRQEKEVADEKKKGEKLEKEARRQEKDAAEEKKRQDKLKKDRQQMRLGGFFVPKPATPAKTPVPNDDSDETLSGARRRSLSLETFDAVADEVRTASPKGTPPPALKPQTPARAAISHYRKHFLPFDVQMHTVLATSQCAARSLEAIEQDQRAFDASVTDPLLQEKYDLGLVSSYASVVDLFPRNGNTARGFAVPAVREVVEKIHGHTTQQPIDLTDDCSSDDPITALQRIPRRYLHFEEDVRPAYFGSYTKFHSQRLARHLSRNPFARERTDTNYDYDSEVEWEEPGEGEDILGDEDDEDEPNGDADEMDEFLDDENDEMKHKRKLITGDLVPISTGLCWEKEAGKSVQSIETNTTNTDLKDMRMDFLLPNFSGTTIDPFSTEYWEPEIMPPPALLVRQPAKQFFDLSSQIASRPPLKERHNSGNRPTIELVGAAQGEKRPINSVASSAAQGEKRGRKAAPKTLSKEDMDEFKDAVVGSQLGKLELCKGLKAR